MFMHNMRHNLPANISLKYWKKLNLLRHFQLTCKLFKFQIWQPGLVIQQVTFGGNRSIAAHMHGDRQGYSHDRSTTRRYLPPD